MIEFLSRHLISVPLSKEPKPKFPLQLLLKAFERVKFKGGVIETYLTNDKILHVTKEFFLKEFGVPLVLKVLQLLNLLLKNFKIC